MRTLFLSFALASTILTGAACGGSDGPSCDKVADHFNDIAPDTLKGNKKAIVEQCKKKMTADDRKCAVAAKDMNDMQACAAKSKGKKG